MAVPTANLELHLPFTEADDSGVVHDTGGATDDYFILGASNQAMDTTLDGNYWFHGSGDPGATYSQGILNSQSFLSTSTGGDESISFLVHPTTISSHDFYIIRNEPAGNRFTVYYNSSGALRWRCRDNSMNCTYALSVNTTTHVAFVFDNTANTMKLYINGSLQETQTNKTSDYVTVSSSTQIGHRDWNDGKGFEGYLRRFRYYQSALSDTDVSDIYDADIAELSGSTTPENSLFIGSNF